jgi:DNA-binding transcriptional MerR regulator
MEVGFMAKIKRIHQVAEELGISEKTIRRLEARGFIDPARSWAGQRIFDKETIQKIRDLYMNRSGAHRGSTS